jgi:hypothetical protein
MHCRELPCFMADARRFLVHSHSWSYMNRSKTIKNTLSASDIYLWAIVCADGYYINRASVSGCIYWCFHSAMKNAPQDGPEARVSFSAGR